MNQTLVANINNKNVYLINNKSVPFYICLPSSGKASIVLNLVNDSSGISMDNNMTELTSRVSEVYNKFNFADVAVVMPILDSNLLEQLKLNNDEKVFEYMDNIMGFLINSAYNFLTSNNLEVDNKIKLNANDAYHAFNDWFVLKYDGRVELVDYYNAPVNKFDNTATMAPVLDDVKSAIANDVLDNTSDINVQSAGNSNSSVSSREPGFVSYVLLGVIVAVISLIILYALL